MARTLHPSADRLAADLEASAVEAWIRAVRRMAGAA